MVFAFFPENLVNQFPFPHCRIGFNSQFVANFAKLFFVFARNIKSCVGFNGFGHGNTRVGSFIINSMFAQLNFCSSVQCQCHTFTNLFRKIHHPFVVFVGYINFHYRKFRVVGAVHPFVSEIFGKLVNSFKSTHNQAFQVKFVGNSQVKRNIQRIVMCDKRTCSGSSRDGL